MTIADALAKLAELEKCLNYNKAKNEHWSPEASKVCEEWEKAVNCARAYIIARLAEEDDGK